MSVSGSSEKLTAPNSSVIPTKVLFSFENEDYFDMIDSQDASKVWKSKVMTSSASIKVGE